MGQVFGLPGKPVRISTATADDLETIIQHRIAMFREMGWGDSVLARIERGSRQHLSAAIPGGGYHGILAELAPAGVVGGGGVLVLPWPGAEPRHCWIQNIYVKPEFRRRGIARHIMGALLDWCREQGFASVSLHASDAGRPLYEQLGFRPSNEMRLIF
jgi:GNAT superfamily N-acetyltransferase